MDTERKCLSMGFSARQPSDACFPYCLAFNPFFSFENDAGQVLLCQHSNVSPLIL